MTLHIVCLDGTNQTKTQEHPTNIARIFDTLGGTAGPAGNDSYETSAPAGGRPEVTGKYLPGVGTQGSAVLKVLGNAFGDGIAEPIIRGYTYLSRTAGPGDQIIITGFSRGATAARALAGFVAKRGLLDAKRYAAGEKDDAYKLAIAAWYAYREDKPDIANQARLEWIKLQLGGLPTVSDADFTSPPKIAAVGVFDTVSSLGLPHLDWRGEAVFDFAICDTTLSPDISKGFHALAADETRDLFAPTYWADRAGVIQQVFPGAHSNVGGGYPERGLSDGALEWMLKNLETAGLVCDRTHLNPAISVDALDIARDDAVTFPFIGTPRRARSFPSCVTPSDILKGRWKRDTESLPGGAKIAYSPKGRYGDGTPLL